MSGPSIRRAGLTVVLFAVGGKVLGLVREMVVAATYGTSHIVDVYLAGITVPALIATILYHALPSAFVPIFSGDRSLQERGTVYAWMLIACLAVVAGGLWVFAIPVASWTSGGFASVAQAEVVVVLRIAALSVVLATGEALARARLLAHKRFVQSGASGLLLSVVMIAAIALFPGGGTRTLVWGFVAGSLIVAVWNLLPLGRQRDRSVAAPDRAAPAISFTASWILAVIVIDLIRQMYALIDRHFASSLSEGSIAALQYADLVAASPVAICGTALAIAAFPYLAEAMHRDDAAAVSMIADRAVRWSLFGAIPATVMLGVFGGEVITILFERGAFDSSSRLLTGPILSVFSIGIVPGVLAAVGTRTLYSAGKWRIVLAATLAGIAAKYTLSLWWIGVAGAAGLAAATVASSLTIAVVLFTGLPHHCVKDNWMGWLRLGIVVAGTFLAGALPTRWLLGSLSQGAVSSALLRIAVGLSLGTTLLLIVGPLTGVAEISKSLSYFRERLLRR